MRGLTPREITVRHWVRVTLKELTSGFINGIAIAITCGPGVYIWSRSIGLALIIALAMISSMMLAAIAGALVPLVLKRLGQDPALSSSIILTTVTAIALASCHSSGLRLGCQECWRRDEHVRQ